MLIANCTKPDFNQILDDVSDFWGSDRTIHLHHPMFLYEFGDSAFVAREDELVVGYLFGFIAQTSSTGYVHLISVRQSHQGRGIGRALYQRFIDFARARGCTEIKAITSPTNAPSIAFHRQLGMELIGTPNQQGIPVVIDYGGRGKTSVVFRTEL